MVKKASYRRAWKRALYGFVAAFLLLVSLPGAGASRAGDSQLYGVQEFAVRYAPESQDHPVISGSRVIWHEPAGEVRQIHGRNLATGQEFMFTTGNDYGDYDIDGDLLVTSENELGQKGIFAYRLTDFSRVMVAPLAGESGFQRLSPRVSGDIVVWLEGDSYDNLDVYAHDLATGQTFPICAGPGRQEWPAVSGNVVVWADPRNRGGTDLLMYDLYGYDLTSQREFRITSQCEVIGAPAISGDTVVWWAQRDRAYRILAYDISTGQETALATLGYDRGELSVDIDGNIAVWSAPTGWPSGDMDIVGYDLEQEEQFIISRAIGHQTVPRISGRTVVWTDLRHQSLGKYQQNADIYGANLTPGPAPVPPVIGAPDAADARIQIVWPDGGKPVSEASRANIGTYLVQRGTLKPTPCQWKPQVLLWRAVNNEPARMLAEGVRRPYSLVWEHNDVDVSPAQDPNSRVFFFITINGTDSQTNVWAHAVDARTYFPHQDVPTGTTEPGPAVDAKIEIVWPHEGAPVTEARLANITANLFKAGTLQSVPPNWEQTVRLWRSLNNGVAEEVAVGEKRLVTRNGLAYPVWDFNDVDVSEARDPQNKLYFLVTVDGVQTYSNVWAHGADARTYFPIWDQLEGGCE